MTAFQAIRQRLLKGSFEPGAFPKQPRVTPHQQGVQARIIEHLKRQGGIDALTIQSLGTTDARKIASRVRDKGYLFPADDVNGHEDRPIRSGHGKYRWHKWTGKE